MFLYVSSVVIDGTTVPSRTELKKVSPEGRETVNLETLPSPRNSMGYWLERK